MNKKAQTGMLGVVLIGVIIIIAILMLVRQAMFSTSASLEYKYFDRVANNALFSLLASTDDDLEKHVTVYDLIKAAKEGRKVGIKDAKTYTPQVIDHKMVKFKERFLDRYGQMNYYFYVGDIARPTLSAGEYGKYEDCKKDPTCRLQAYSASFEDIYLMIYKMNRK